MDSPTTPAERYRAVQETTQRLNRLLAEANDAGAPIDLEVITGGRDAAVIIPHRRRSEMLPCAAL